MFDKLLYYLEKAFIYLCFGTGFATIVGALMIFALWFCLER